MTLDSSGFLSSGGFSCGHRPWSSSPRSFWGLSKSTPNSLIWFRSPRK
jgi:hypothetical protein